MGKRGPKPAPYALYKGEELKAIGTVREIARTLGLSAETVRHYRDSYASKRVGDNYTILVRLED